jgi:hypothetical protein
LKRLFVILVVLGLILGGLAWADVRIRTVAEDEARARLAEAVPQAQRTEVEISGFPFVGRILLDGSIERLSLTLHDVREGGVEVERLQLVAEQIVLDRARLLEDRVLAVTDVGRVRVEGRVSAAMISRAAGVPVHFKGGKASVTVNGQTVEASVSFVGNVVMLWVVGFPPLSVPLPAHAILPCQPEVRIADEYVELACSATELPAAVMDVLGKGTG